MIIIIVRMSPVTRQYDNKAACADQQPKFTQVKSNHETTMIFRVALLLCVLGVAAAQLDCPEVPAGGCNVCAAGECITAPDAIFTFSGQPDIPCGALQQAGLAGQVPNAQCNALPPLILICECMPGNVVAPPTGAPLVGVRGLAHGKLLATFFLVL